MNAQIQCWRCSQAISVHRDMIGQELFCPNCGSKNGVPAAAFESSATQRFAPPPPAGAIPNYLWQSIVVTLLCCLPFGVVAIVYAAQVNTKLIAGDVSGARAASSSAKNWCMASFFCGLGGCVVWFLLAIASA